MEKKIADCRRFFLAFVFLRNKGRMKQRRTRLKRKRRKLKPRRSGKSWGLFKVDRRFPNSPAKRWLRRRVISGGSSKKTGL